MKKLLLLTLTLLLTLPMLASQKRWAGGDISLLPEYEKAGAKYLDPAGNLLPGSLLDYLKTQNWDVMRVRLFVAPDKYTGSDKDPNACQDFDYILPLCQRIVDAGYALMLDFHYSDTWADPAQQWTPADWASLNDEQLYTKIYDYTRQVLTDLKANGVTPTFIATGNEISYGMLWGPVGTPEKDQKRCYINSDANWDRLTTLLKQAGKACREVCPDAQIILHTERTADLPVQDNFYKRMNEAGVDYDIVGLSYYPYFHGDLKNLRGGIEHAIATSPGKQVQIVELGYSYAWEVPGTKFDFSGTWPYSQDGQQKFVEDVVSLCEGYDECTALLWWWPEYNAYGTQLTGWYNAALFDSRTGKASPAIGALGSFSTSDSSVGMLPADPSAPAGEQPWYTTQGVRLPGAPTLPGLYIHGGRTVLIR